MSERRVVIVGASAAGLRCACRLSRLRPEWSITVVERRDTFSIAACGLPYLLSGDVESLDELRRTGDGALRDEAYFRDVKGVAVRSRTSAEAIDTQARLLTVKAADGSRAELAWDDLVIATGAVPRRLPGQPNHPRVHVLHTAEDTRAIHRQLAAGTLSRVVVVGAGLVGIELAEAFRALWGVGVTLIEAAPAVLPGVVDEEIGKAVGSALVRGGVALQCGSAVQAIEAGAGGVTVRAGAAAFTADAAVVAVGVRPEVALAASAGVKLGPTGAIAVSPELATSLPGIWAAGDCIEVRNVVSGEACHLPLGSLANRQGRALANTLAGRPEAFPAVAGAIAVKAFDWNVAAVGITRARAASLGFAARSVWVTAHDRAVYWPEAREVFIHLVYEHGTRRILGVQAAGAGEVAKRVDVAAQLIGRGATLEDLAAIEHAYAPPYAPAVDPLAVAAWVAQNQEDGIEASSPLADLAGARVLDVRHPEEVAERPAPVPGAAAMPLEALRARGGTLANEAWLTVCERGTRAAEALRWLRAHGRGGSYLGGGMRLRALLGGEGR